MVPQSRYCWATLPLRCQWRLLPTSSSSWGSRCSWACGCVTPRSACHHMASSSSSVSSCFPPLRTRGLHLGRLGPSRMLPPLSVQVTLAESLLPHKGTNPVLESHQPAVEPSLSHPHSAIALRNGALQPSAFVSGSLHSRPHWWPSSVLICGSVACAQSLLCSRLLRRDHHWFLRLLLRDSGLSPVVAVTGEAAGETRVHIHVWRTQPCVEFVALQL